MAWLANLTSPYDGHSHRKYGEGQDEVCDSETPYCAASLVVSEMHSGLLKMNTILIIFNQNFGFVIKKF